MGARESKVSPNNAEQWNDCVSNLELETQSLRLQLERKEKEAKELRGLMHALNPNGDTPDLAL